MRLDKKIISIFVTVLVFGLFVSAPVNAQSANANAAQGMQISPTLVDLNAARGKTYEIKLNITNITGSDLVYTSSVDDFNANDETGSPHIILDSTLPETASIKTWVVTVPEFTLESQQTRTVIAQILIPNNAEPGGHYGVLRFSGSAPDIESTGVGLSASAGMLILIRVDGEITEKADLSSFYSSNGDKQTSFFENGPITFITRIKNDGNIHIKPFGNIELKDMFGNIVKTMSVNDDKSNILPNSTRRFETKYDTKWMFGRYSADLTIGYGTTGQAITNTISFWVIPYKIILIGLFVLATVVYVLKRLITVYNRHIINKSKNENNKKGTNKKV